MKIATTLMTMSMMLSAAGATLAAPEKPARASKPAVATSVGVGFTGPAAWVRV